MKIFIGCSEKYKVENEDFINALLTYLREQKHEILPWWEIENFNDTFIKSIVKQSRICDGGIFIFGNDDIISDGREITRDNVLIEYGIFYSIKPKYTIPIIGKNVHIPSDLQSRNFPKLGDKNLLNKLNKYFILSKPNSQVNKLIFYLSKEVVKDCFKKKTVKDWVSRALYIGLESARKWSKIEEADDYKGLDFLNGNPKGSNEFFAKIKGEKFINIISLGPGTGKIDQSFYVKIKGDSTKNYIPIDINPYLAGVAIEKMLKLSCNVPFAIIGDFEESIEEVVKIINSKTIIKEQKKLFLMLGLTFSNIETSEDLFLPYLSNLMSFDDYLLIDVLCYYKKNDDSKNYTESISGLNNSYKEFFIHALQKRSDDPQLKDIKMEKFDEHIEIVKCENNNTKYSLHDDIIISQYISNSEKDSPPLLIGKRYFYDSIKEEFNKNFQLVNELSIVEKNKETFGRSLFLLKKNNRKVCL